MRITIKNLQQQTFIVEINDSQTILELKQEIQKLKGMEYEVERQKLIYAGIILDDDKTISSYKMDDKKFVVVMVKRELGKQVAASSSQTKDANNVESQKRLSKPEAVTETAAIGNSMSKEEKPTEEVANVRQSSSNEPTGATSLQIQAESNLLTGQEYENTVKSIIEMGYSRDMVERAMVASYNNPERAVEYLVIGIPEVRDEAAREPIAMQNDVAPDLGVTQRNTSNILASNSSDNPFEFLRNQPQFSQMRSLVHQNPDLLHSVLQQIGETNPALLQLIFENQESFLNMLNQPLDDTAATNPITSSMLSNLSSVVEEGGTNRESRQNTTEISGTGTNRENEQGSGMATIRLTSEDQEAIERLKALGFSEVLVLQAYFACEKNEELAANFLLSSTFDD